MLAFIAAAAAAAIVCARTPTIAAGRVVAADILAQKKAFGWKTLDCESFEIKPQATFECRLELNDGDKARLGMTLTPQGSFLINPIEVTHPEHSHVTPKADPWE